MRIYFRKSDKRFVRGGLIFKLQRALAAAGHPTPSIDGVYGNDTKTALAGWQAANGHDPTGEADAASWTALTGEEAPGLFERCIQITGAYEGHGYGKAAGNFDDAFLTWGIIGFTLKHGNLKKVVEEIEASAPGQLAGAMGADKADAFQTALGGSRDEQKAFGDSISAGSKKYKLVEDWDKAFKALGATEAAQRAQEKIARDTYFSRALKDLKTYGEPTELDAALFFDIAVQNGSVERDEGEKILAWRAAHPQGDPTERRRITADAVAEGSNPRWVEDVRSRKRTFSPLVGEVHGVSYRVTDWGLGEAEFDPASV